MRTPSFVVIHALKINIAFSPFAISACESCQTVLQLTCDENYNQLNCWTTFNKQPSILCAWFCLCTKPFGLTYHRWYALYWIVAAFLDMPHFSIISKIGAKIKIWKNKGRFYSLLSDTILLTHHQTCVIIHTRDFS